jgi:hypothetical protein
VLSHLASSSVPCSEPLSWSHGRRAPHGLHEILVTREIAGSTSLDRLLREPRVTIDLVPLLQLVRRMHDSGVSHGGLAPRNILVTNPERGQPAFHLIDMAYGHVFPRGIAGTRMAAFDLLDLMYQLRRHFPSELCSLWVAAYGQDDPAVQKLMARLVRYRPRRPWSHLRRGETDLRAVMARLRTARNSRDGDNRASRS